MSSGITIFLPKAVGNIDNKRVTVSEKKNIVTDKFPKAQAIDFNDQSINELNSGLADLTHAWGKYCENSSAELNEPIEEADKTLKEHFIKSLKNGITFYLNNHTKTINIETLISLITNLFYSKDGIELPKIYQIIQDLLQAEEIGTGLKELNKLKEQCEIFSKLIDSVSITKHNTIFSDNKNFDAVLKVSIDNVILYLDQQIKAEESICQIRAENDDIRKADKIKNLVCNMVDDVETILHYNKIGGTIESTDKKNANKQYIAISSILGQVSNASPTTGYITGDLSNPSLDKTETNIAVKTLLGSLWAVSTAMQAGNSAVFMQGLGLEKARLLRLCKKLKELGYDFTKAQQKHLGKLFKLKRGNFIENAFTWNTNSYNEFRKIMDGETSYAKTVFSRIKQASSSKNLNNNVSEVKKNHTYKQAHTRVDISAQIIECIEKEDFNKLRTYIKTLGQENKKLFSTIIFELKYNDMERLKEKVKFRGNLISYLMVNNNLYSENSEFKNLQSAVYSLYQNELSQVEIAGLLKKNADGSLQKYTISDLKTKTYIELRELLGSLKKYTSSMKYQCLLDITHIILAIALHPTLSVKAKGDLRQYIQDQIELKGDGRFRGIRDKRNTLGQNVALGAAFYNINQSAYYVDTFHPLSHASLIAGNAFVEGVLATLAPVTEWMSRGATTTYKNVNAMSKFDVNQELSYTASAAEAENLQTVLNNASSNTVTIKYNQNNTAKITYNTKNNSDVQNIQRHDPQQNKLDDINFQDATIGEIKIWVLNQIQKGNYTNVIRVLDNVIKSEGHGTIKKLYYSLTDKVEDSFLLNKLFNEIPNENPSKLKEPSLVDKLRNIWSGIVKVKLSDTNYTSSMNDFRKYIANIEVDNPQLGLVAVYEVIAVIKNKNCDDPKLAQEMAKYFAGVIYRAADDRTSKWYNLLKRCYSDELTLRSFFRALGWGISTVTVVSMVTASHGLAVPVILAILAAGGIANEFVTAHASNFTHARTTKEYENAIELVGLDMNEEELQRLISSRSSSSNLDMLNMPMARDVMSLNGVATRETTTSYIEKVIELGDYSSDKANQANNVSAKYSYNPQGDKNYAEKLAQCTTEEGKCNYINTIIEDITEQVVDKYTANEALFRIMAIVSAGIVNKIERLAMIASIATAFKDRGLLIAQIASKERSFYTKNNYLIPQMLIGALSGLTYFARVPGITGVNIFPIYQTLIGGAGNTGVKILTLFSNDDSEYCNTDSYQKGMHFMKNIILDLVIDLDNDYRETKIQHLLINEQYKEWEEWVRYEKIRLLAEEIIKTHTGWSALTRIGKTSHEKKLPPSPFAQKETKPINSTGTANLKHGSDSIFSLFSGFDNLIITA